MEQDPQDRWRKYEIAVTAEHLTSQTEIAVTQEVRINNGQLFNFSVFYNEALEIGPGYSFDIQGPIFSNKNIFLMNQPGEANAITIRKAADFKPTDPEPYALASAGSIYFFFNRTPARNYLLDKSGYLENAPSYDIDSSGGKLELAPDYAIGRTSMFPYFYYFGSDVTLKGPPPRLFSRSFHLGRNCKRRFCSACARLSADQPTRADLRLPGHSNYPRIRPAAARKFRERLFRHG